MALDQGTTSSRTILFSEKGEIVADANAPLACHYPQSGWVEQDPQEIWTSQSQTIQEALKKAALKIPPPKRTLFLKKQSRDFGKISGYGKKWLWNYLFLIAFLYIF